MRVVRVDVSRLDYDIHSLTKAFYPEDEVKVITPDTAVEKAEELAKDIFLDIHLDDTHPNVVFCDKTYEIATDLCDKNSIKAELYQCLSDYTGKKLPWGNLTGIRPTKISTMMLDEGKTDADVEAFMKGQHFVSDEKIALSLEISHLERKILEKIDVKHGYSLYIGIPFCPTTCLYCSFTSYPIGGYRELVEHYIDCVIEELKETKEIMKDKVLQSVYIGGGTPTTLEPAQLQRLIDAIKANFSFDEVLEFTVEAGRPDSITKEKLQVLKDCGVSRISVNPQTMKDETLKIIGRRHTVEQLKNAYALAREVGLDNINMDLILGLPGELEEDVANTIREVQALNPDSITVHSLAIKRASKLRHWIEERDISCLHNTDDTMEIAAKGARKMGMKPYYLYRQKNMSGNFENVGYAKPGKFGIYNILIMEEVQTIVACGAGTITKRVFPDGRIERCDNVKDVKLYMEQIEEMIERKKELFSDQM